MLDHFLNVLNGILFSIVLFSRFISDESMYVCKHENKAYKHTKIFAGPRNISSKNASVPNIFNVSLFRYTQQKPQTAT